MGERRSDTRERIRTVALELFAEQGYEKTSLREIAERLGVTKAALYYHFRTKEDIITSLFRDTEAEIDKILEWAKQQPMTADLRQEAIRKYAEVLHGPGGELMRFMAENGPSIKGLKGPTEARNRLTELSRLLSEDDVALADRLRMRLSLFSLHLGVLLMRDLDVSDEERHAAALEVALDLAAGREPASSRPGGAASA